MERRTTRSKRQRDAGASPADALPAASVACSDTVLGAARRSALHELPRNGGLASASTNGATAPSAKDSELHAADASKRRRARSKGPGSAAPSSEVPPPAPPALLVPSQATAAALAVAGAGAERPLPSAPAPRQGGGSGVHAGNPAALEAAVAAGSHAPAPAPGALTAASVNAVWQAVTRPRATIAPGAFPPFPHSLGSAFVAPHAQSSSSSSAAAAGVAAAAGAMPRRNVPVPTEPYGLGGAAAGDRGGAALPAASNAAVRTHPGLLPSAASSSNPIALHPGARDVMVARLSAMTAAANAAMGRTGGGTHGVAALTAAAAAMPRPPPPAVPSHAASAAAAAAAAAAATAASVAVVAQSQAASVHVPAASSSSSSSSSSTSSSSAAYPVPRPYLTPTKARSGGGMSPDGVQWAAVYIDDVYWANKSKEAEKSPKYGYLERQPQLNDKCRAILIDWLCGVHDDHNLLPETFFLAVNLLDRYLERVTPVSRLQLQLVGVAALWVASKHEEEWQHEVTLTHMVDATAGAYSKQEIQVQESRLLANLDFRVSVPTAYTFLSRLLQAAGIDEGSPIAHLAAYVAELTLVQYRFLRHLPSAVAASALNMAMRTLLGPDAWTPALEASSGWTQTSLRSLIWEIQDYALGSSGPTAQEMKGYGKLASVHRKYAHDKREGVALQPIAALPMPGV